MTIDWQALAAPFPADAVSWRVGSTTKDKSRGMALAYIDARDVMRRLDDVCGPANWQCRYSHAAQKTVCDLGIKVGGEWVWKADGAGDSDIEAEKGSLSDAFKRSAVRWGIGRYLYDLDSPWVELKDGKFIAEGETAKLRALLTKKGAPPPPEPKRPDPQPISAPQAAAKTAQGWAYVTVDGKVERIATGGEWFKRIEADARKNDRRGPDLWAVNAAVGKEIVESQPDQKTREAAQRKYDETARLIEDIAIPLIP